MDGIFAEFLQTVTVPGLDADDTLLDKTTFEAGSVIPVLRQDDDFVTVKAGNGATFRVPRRTVKLQGLEVRE